MEEQVVEHNTHTVSFTRKVSDGKFGSQEATWFLQFDTPKGIDDGELIAIAEQKIQRCKSVVLEQLGVEFTVNESGVIIELAPELPTNTPARPTGKVKVVEAGIGQTVKALENAFGGVEVAEDPDGVVVQFPDRTDRDPDVVPPAASNAIPEKPSREWLLARLESHPQEFYDNRQKKASGQYKDSAADFKHKATGAPLWLKPKTFTKQRSFA